MPFRDQRLQSFLGSFPSPSRLQHLLTSNDLPLDEELPHLYNILDNYSKRLDALETDTPSESSLAPCPSFSKAAISQQGLSSDLCSSYERIHIQGKLSELKLILSPVRKLPIELLLQIFEHYHTITQDALGPGFRIVCGHLLSSGPWVLCAVSQRWRACAEGYAKFWGSIRMKRLRFPFSSSHSPIPSRSPPTFNFRTSTVESISPLLHLIQKTITLSSPYKIKLTIDLGCDGLINTQATNEIMRVLGTCWERWDKAAISFSANSIFNEVLARLDGGAAFDTWKPLGVPVNNGSSVDEDVERREFLTGE
jgi:hypothetical protein